MENPQVRQNGSTGLLRVLGFVLSLSAQAGLAARPCDDGGLLLQPVAASVWRLPAARGEPDNANGGLTIQLVLVRESGSRVWLVGSGPTPAFGAALACAAQRVAGHAVTDVVNTRAAPELALGNGAFPGARLWALPSVIRTMRHRCPACLKRLQGQLNGPPGASLRGARVHVPFVPVREARLGPFAALALEREPGESVLVLRLGRVVIAQGLLWADAVPDLRDTRSDTLLASLHALQGFAGVAPDTRLIGEQGEVTGPDAITAQIAYLDDLRQAVGRRLQAGEVQGAVPLPAYAALPGYATLHPLNVQRVWRELEPMLFR